MNEIDEIQAASPLKELKVGRQPFSSSSCVSKQPLTLFAAYVFALRRNIRE
jgi:hypothetical protein